MIQASRLAKSVGKETILGGAVATFGKARNIKSSQHPAASISEAEKIVRELGLNNVSRVRFNQNLDTIFGVGGKIQPDIVAITRDGRIVISEVVSPSQTQKDMLEKIEKMQNLAGLPESSVTARAEKIGDILGDGTGRLNGSELSGLVKADSPDLETPRSE